MKKIFALLVALAMLFSAAALAEDGTVYSLALLDPQIVVGEKTIDLAGLELDLSAAVTDYGPQSLVLEAYAGEEYEYVTGLFAQLEEAGLSFYYNGMENVYAVDLEALSGMSAADLLSALPLRTLLAEVDLEAFETASVALTAEDRIAILESALGGFVYETLQQDDGVVSNFSITREQGGAMLMPVLAMAASVSPELSELAEFDFSFDLSGSIIANGSPSAGDAAWAVVAEGTLYGADDVEEIAIPITLDYADDMNAFSLTFAMTYEEETISVALEGAAEVLGDGRPSVYYLLTLDVVGEVSTLAYTVAPEEGSQRVDTTIELSADEDETSVKLDVITDFDPDSAYSFYIALTADDGYGESMMDFYYVGDPVDDSELGVDVVGWAEVTLSAPDMEDMAVNASVVTFRQEMDSEDWLVDASDAIDVTTMTDEDLEAASEDAMAVFQDDLATIMERVPALEDLLG